MTSRVLVALRVPGPPDRAFRVFTEDMALWWRDSPLLRFTPRSPGVLRFERPENGGIGRLVEDLPTGKTFLIGEITAWEPGSRLAFGWRQATFLPGQATHVTVTFEAIGAETRVTVEHAGWDSVPPENAARHQMGDRVFHRRLGAWWRAALSSLKISLT